MLQKAKSNHRGFTFIEVIAVLIIIAVIAGVAVSRSVDYSAEVYAGADALKAHLRYAQTMAMNSNPSSGVAIWGISSTGSSYWLFQGTDPAATATYIRLPEDETFLNSDRTINLTKKKIKISFSSGATIYFDNRGIPYSAYTSTTVNTPLAGALTINVQPLSAATPSVVITITPQTGYIP